MTIYKPGDKRIWTFSCLRKQRKDFRTGGLFPKVYNDFRSTQIKQRDTPQGEKDFLKNW